MARLNSQPPFTKTIGPVTVYAMFGKYYIGSRSSLTAERVRKDLAFRKTRQYAALLANASRIASHVYALIPFWNKKHTLYLKLTGEAMTWLKYEWKEGDIIEYMLAHYTYLQLPVQAPVTRLRPSCRRSRPLVSRIAPSGTKIISGEYIL